MEHCQLTAAVPKEPVVDIDNVGDRDPSVLFLVGRRPESSGRL
jgi:hypothetical protein